MMDNEAPDLFSFDAVDDWPDKDRPTQGFDLSNSRASRAAVTDEGPPDIADRSEPSEPPPGSGNVSMAAVDRHGSGSSETSPLGQIANTNSQHLSYAHIGCANPACPATQDLIKKIDEDPACKNCHAYFKKYNKHQSQKEAETSWELRQWKKRLGTPETIRCGNPDCDATIVMPGQTTQSKLIKGVRVCNACGTDWSANSRWRTKINGRQSNKLAFTAKNAKYLAEIEKFCRIGATVINGGDLGLPQTTAQSTFTPQAEHGEDYYQAKIAHGQQPADASDLKEDLDNLKVLEQGCFDAIQEAQRRIMTVSTIIGRYETLYELALEREAQPATDGNWSTAGNRMGGRASQSSPAVVPDGTVNTQIGASGVTQLGFPSAAQRKSSNFNAKATKQSSVGPGLVAVKEEDATNTAPTTFNASMGTSDEGAIMISDNEDEEAAYAIQRPPKRKRITRSQY